MTMSPGGELIVVGAGGFGRETVEAVYAMNDAGAHWQLLGYLDDDGTLEGSYVDGVPVLGPLDHLKNYPEARVVVCTGRPDNYASRSRIVDRLSLPVERYATVLHPTVALSTCSQVGAGSVLLAQTVLTAGVTVRSHVAVMPHATLTHDDVVDDFVTIASGVQLGGGVHIGESAYLGAGAQLREGVAIGSWSLIGMGSVVLQDVPPGEVWAGVPARYIRAANHK